jgi:hypothetical protein
MPIKTVQTSDLTAQSLIVNSTHGVNGTYTGADDLPNSALSHQQLDENFNSIWPIGSVYINVSSDANPRDLIGFGFWASLGRQTILVGKNGNLAHQTVTLSVADGSGFRGDELVAGGTSGAKGRIHRFISTNEFVVEPLIEGSAFQESETITGEDSGASTTINVGGVGASLTSTNQGLSSKISSVSVFSDITQRKSELIITTAAAHKFSKGQRVTLSGITGATGAVNPNREREIVSIESSTKFRVDYRSPSSESDLARGIVFSTGLDEPLSSANASATLFGTRYDESQSSRAEQIPFAGTGGTIGQKMSVGEFPAHTHTVNWGMVNTISKKLTAGRGMKRSDPRIGNGSKNAKFRDEQWGFVDSGRRGKYSGRGLTDDVKLAARANGDTYTVNGTQYLYHSAREAHCNLMPFIGAYFWVRIPEPVFDETLPEDE